ncbi:MAG: FHA domain-containing protein [Acidobacteria bacterium]|nr:FHA domain-containing protein [Acidobacteriota bacterium]
MTRPDTTSEVPRFNTGTRCEIHRVSSLSPRQAFEAVFDALRHGYDAASPGHYLLAHVDLDALSLRMMVIAPQPGQGSDLVIGRHTRCDLVVEHADSVSLRHLLLRLEPGEPGAAPRFTLLDLATANGFLDETGSTRHGLEGIGDCIFRVENHQFFLLHRRSRPWPDIAARAWEGLPERNLSEGPAPRPDDAGRPPAEPVPIPGRESPEGAARRKDITMYTLSPVISLDCFSEAAGRDAFDPWSPSINLLVEDEHRSREIRLTDAELRRGVLLGRYERCRIGGDEEELDLLVSRVHLLLWKHRGAYWAVDTASSNGTLCDGAPFHSRRLAPDAVHFIAVANRLLLTWNHPGTPGEPPSVPSPA